jgi:hypothetical protein
MKVEQHPYCSPEAMRLRHRDGIPPWGCHPCEVDSLPEPEPGDATPFACAWRAAAALRAEIEAEHGEPQC